MANKYNNNEMILHVILIPTPRRQEYSFLYHFDTFSNLLSGLWVYKTCPLDAFRLLISYPVIYRTSYVVSSGFVPSPHKRHSLSLTRLLLQLVSGILRFHKTSLFTVCFFSCPRMSSFFLFSYDSPQPSSSMKLSPFCATRRSYSLFSLYYHLFLPIPLHPYCRCNPRYSAELSLFASILSERCACNCRSCATLSNSIKTLPCTFSWLQHHLSSSFPKRI